MEIATVYLAERIYQTANDRRNLFDKLLPDFIDLLSLYGEAKICDCQLPMEAREKVVEISIRLEEIFPKHGLILGFDAQEDFYLRDAVKELERFKEKINGTARPDDLTYLNHRLEKIIQICS